MVLTMLKAKIHRATVTRANLEYEGSITIDSEFLRLSGILPYEKVDVLNITNGNRLTTYVIDGKAGSKEIGINGAAAHLVSPGDLVIICAYIQIDAKEAVSWEPKIVLLDKDNVVKSS